MGTRRERVVLDLESNLAPGLMRDAAAAELLNDRINALSRRAVESRRANREMGDGLDDLSRKTRSAGNDIDKLSGRMRIFADLAAVFGPTGIPGAAVAAVGISGLASQLGFAALGAGVAVLAFHGVGDALKAMNKAALEPTAENLEAARQAMNAISPDAQKFVQTLRDLQPQLKATQQLAAEGVLPGWSEGLDALVTRMPDVQRIVGAVAGELGDIGESVGDSLASKRWDDFFTFLATDAPSALNDMATAAGNTGHALAEFWMDFDPLNDDFSTWLVGATEKLDQLATGLDSTAGFNEFMDYVDANGPKVGNALGAIANAMLQIVEAAAPIGGPVLDGVTAFANLFASIADSDLGTPIFGALAALSALNLAMRTSASLSKATFGGPAVAGIRQQIAGYKGIAVAQREVTAATTKLSMAQLASQGAAVRARNAQFALIPDSAKRAAVKDYTSAVGRQAEAEKHLASVTKSRNGVVREGAASIGKAGAAVAGLAVLTTGLGDKMHLSNTASLALMGTIAGPWGSAIGGGVGAVLDLAHANDGLSDSLNRLDAMAGRVDFDTFNTQLGDAQKKLDDLNHTSGFKDFFSDGLKQLSGMMKGDLQNDDFWAGTVKLSDSKQKDFHEAQLNQMQAGRIAGAEAAARAAGVAGEAAAHGYEATSQAADEAARSVEQLTAAMNAANAAMGNVSSKDALRTALLDARDFVKDSGKVLRANGEIKKGSEEVQRAGISARAQLVQIGSQAQQAGEKMKDGWAKTKFLDDTRQQFISVAKAMGMSGPAAQKMANNFGLIDRVTRRSSDAVGDLNSKIRSLKSKIVDAKAKGAKESSPQVQALRAQIAALRNKVVNIKQSGAEAAAAEARRVAAAIAAIHDKTVHIRAIRSVGATGIQKLSADGDTVPKTGLPYADRHPYLLADGERIVSNRYGQVDANADILDAINNSRGRLQGFADGGTAGGARKRRQGGKPGKSKKNQDHPVIRHQLKEFNAALDRATKAIDRETAARDAVVSKRDDLRSTVTGAFTSDPFGQTDVWGAGGGVGGANGILMADIAKAKEFRTVMGQLSRAGLDGDALASVASKGDLGLAQAMASSGKANIQQYEQLFNQRAAAASAAGNYTGAAAYQAQIVAMNKHLYGQTLHQKRLEAQVKRLETALKHNGKETGKHVGKAINKASRAGQRQKVNSR